MSPLIYLAERQMELQKQQSLTSEALNDAQQAHQMAKAQHNKVSSRLNLMGEDFRAVRNQLIDAGVSEEGFIALRSKAFDDAR